MQSSSIVIALIFIAVFIGYRLGERGARVKDELRNSRLKLEYTRGVHDGLSQALDILKRNREDGCGGSNLQNVKQ